MVSAPLLVVLTMRSLARSIPGRQGRELGAFAVGLATLGAVTGLYAGVLGVTNPTIVALSFLLAVLFVATVSTQRVAVVLSLVAFLCFNYFFLPPVGMWTVSESQNLVALFALLAVSLVGSHLSSLARRRAQEAAGIAIERARLLEERADAELLRRSIELRSALLASLAHDLRTPLTAVTVSANNLDASWLTAEQRREQAAIVRAELARLNRLFENIVEMARIETAAVAAEKEWVEPGEIVEAAVRQAEAALAGHPVEWTGDGDKGLVRVDPRLTSVALAHILENAGQYSPPGTTITVTVVLAPHEVRIAVRDRGPGVAPRDLPYLFERSYRGIDARQQRFGTGMGLAISRGLLEVEGGRVVADSNPEGGAIFTIVVPAEMRPAAALEEQGA